MRVLYFHQHFSTREGASTTRSYEMARALLAAGHQVTMVCGVHAHSGLKLAFDRKALRVRALVEGIDVIALNLPYSNKDSLARRAWTFARYAINSVIIALVEPHDLLFATSTPLTAALPGIATKMLGSHRPFIFEVRDLWPELPRALGMKNPFVLAGMSALEWFAYRAADACVGLSPGMVEGIKRRRRRGGPVVMIPNGSDLELFRPDNRTRIASPGIFPTDFLAGFTGAHGKANGLDAVLDAARVLKERRSTRIKLVFIGDGSDKERLVRRARDEALNNCIFHPAISKTEIAGVTAGLDCGLMILADVPAFYQGTSPNKFFDYISAGLPVVCNYPGWMAELITDNECGLVAPPGRAEALATVLERLAGDSALCAKMGGCARRLADREFGRKKLAGEFVRLLEASLASKSRCRN